MECSPHCHHKALGQLMIWIAFQLYSQWIGCLKKNAFIYWLSFGNRLVQFKSFFLISFNAVGKHRKKCAKKWNANRKLMNDCDQLPSIKFQLKSEVKNCFTSLLKLMMYESVNLRKKSFSKCLLIGREKEFKCWNIFHLKVPWLLSCRERLFLHDFELMWRLKWKKVKNTLAG